MKAVQKEPETIWKKVGPCLYRYAPSGVYYGLIKNAGKQIRRSLEIDDLPLARRKLQDMRRDIALTDPELARRTLELQAERFLPTVSGSESTIYNVKHAIKRLLADWPKTSPRVLAKIPKGDCEQWIATYGHLAASTINTYISCATKFFDLAVSDGAIARSPMEGITYHRRGKLTRLTPTAEQFEAVVKDLKAQAFNGHDAKETGNAIKTLQIDYAVERPGPGMIEKVFLRRYLLPDVTADQVEIKLVKGCLYSFALEKFETKRGSIFARLGPWEPVMIDKGEGAGAPAQDNSTAQ